MSLENLSLVLASWFLILKGFKACFKHMNDWQYLSLEDQQQKEFFPKRRSGGFLVP